MTHRFLGKSGLRVSELCLGSTMSFRPDSTEAESRRMFDRFAEVGGNFFDTADVYADGEAERRLGRWLKGRKRDAVVVATKVHFRTDADPNGEGSSRKHLVAGVEASLRRMETDFVDLLHLHCWDPGTPVEETITALDSLVRSGKVRYLGVSNFCGWQLQKAVDVARALKTEPFVSAQLLYNLLDRTVEWELVPVCVNEGLSLLPWSPLRGGWLGGGIRRGMTGPPAGSTVEGSPDGNWARYASERTWRVLDALWEVSSAVGRTPAQVALRWLLQRPGVGVPVVGARNLAQLEDSFGAVGWSLSAEQMARLDAAGEIELPYPLDYIARSTPARRR